MKREEIIKNLIDDEIEAIDGYNNAIKELPEYKDIFDHIAKEEQEHIKELSNLLEKKNKYYFGKY